MQSILETKVMTSRLGGQTGHLVSRATFAVIIKFSGLQEEFLLAIDEYDILMTEIKQDDPEFKKKVKEAIVKFEGYDEIFNNWKKSAEMRVQMQEVYKTINDQIA